MMSAFLVLVRRLDIIVEQSFAFSFYGACHMAVTAPWPSLQQKHQIC